MQITLCNLGRCKNVTEGVDLVGESSSPYGLIRASNIVTIAASDFNYSIFDDPAVLLGIQVRREAPLQQLAHIHWHAWHRSKSL